MEEILASIRRIIADDDVLPLSRQPSASLRPVQPAPQPGPAPFGSYEPQRNAAPVQAGPNALRNGVQQPGGAAPVLAIGITEGRVKPPADKSNDDEERYRVRPEWYPNGQPQNPYPAGTMIPINPPTPGMQPVPMQPGMQPTAQPTAQPSEKPSRQPTEQPSSRPTRRNWRNGCRGSWNGCSRCPN
jgi:cell pole-organizing protein PopZ